MFMHAISKCAQVQNNNHVIVEGCLLEQATLNQTSIEWEQDMILLA